MKGSITRLLKYSSHKIFSEKPRYFDFSNIFDTNRYHFWKTLFNKNRSIVSKMLEKWKYRGFSEKILCKEYFSVGGHYGYFFKVMLEK